MFLQSPDGGEFGGVWTCSGEQASVLGSVTHDRISLTVVSAPLAPSHVEAVLGDSSMSGTITGRLRGSFTATR
jgi:hypothetical protein